MSLVFLVALVNLVCYFFTGDRLNLIVFYIGLAVAIFERELIRGRYR